MKFLLKHKKTQLDNVITTCIRNPKEAKVTKQNHETLFFINDKNPNTILFLLSS